MALTTREPSGNVYEMMARLGIELGGAVLPSVGLRYGTAFQRCQACPSKEACRAWLDHAPAAVTFAPWFCVNAEILFELRCDQPGPRFIQG